MMTVDEVPETRHEKAQLLTSPSRAVFFVVMVFMSEALRQAFVRDSMGVEGVMRRNEMQSKRKIPVNNLNISNFI